METPLIVVTSCDAYADCWGPWHLLKSKYWPEANAAVIAETKSVPAWFKPLCVNIGTWTVRVREALKQLDDELIIFMCEDHFIRQPVDQTRIAYAVTQMRRRKKIAAFNFELPYRDVELTNLEGFAKQYPHQPYNHSCQPSIWRREALIKELSKMDGTAAEWELTPDDGEFDYFLNVGGAIIDIGYKDGVWMGLRAGKWVREDMVPLNEKEQLAIDFSERGFF